MSRKFFIAEEVETSLGVRTEVLTPDPKSESGVASRTQPTDR